MTERIATIAPTPIGEADEEEQQPPPRRAHLPHRHRDDEAHRAALRRLAASARSSTGRPSRSVSCASASAATIGIVRHEHQRDRRARCDLQQQIEDVPAVGAVEIAGRLVGEDERRIVGQRARDRDALLFAAGQLRRIVMAAVVQADFVEQRLRARRAHRARPAISIGTRMFSSAVSDGTR